MHITTDMLVNFLAEAPVFKRFEREEIEAFLPHLEFQGVEATHTIFQEGSNGDGWWIVLGGEVSVTKEMPSGPPHVLSHLYPGDTFGEMALIDGAPRMASMRWKTASCTLPREAFLQLLRDREMHAPAPLGDVQVLAQRQRLTLLDLVEHPRMTW